LLDAIRVVARGDALLSPMATKTLIGRFLQQPDRPSVTKPEQLDALTDREREVLSYVGAGMSNDAIAEHLVLSPSTAKTHVNRVMAKLGVRDRAQLVVIAYETGLVRPIGYA
jgi:DNA-binding NarL/FixJ family response regulator